MQSTYWHCNIVTESTLGHQPMPHLTTSAVYAHTWYVFVVQTQLQNQTEPRETCSKLLESFGSWHATALHQKSQRSMWTTTRRVPLCSILPRDATCTSLLAIYTGHHKSRSGSDWKYINEIKTTNDCILSDCQRLPMFPEPKGKVSSPQLESSDFMYSKLLHLDFEM